MTKFVFCKDCQFFSESHNACFHPDAFAPDFPFKSVLGGNWKEINADYHCEWYDRHPPIQPDGRLRGRLSRFKKFIDKLIRK